VANKSNDETVQVAARYARRPDLATDPRYDALNPDVWLVAHQRRKSIIRFLTKLTPMKPLAQLRVLEIGCGRGLNLLELLGLGFNPENLIGIELLPERAVLARRNLPHAIKIIEGDAATIEIPEGSLDIVYQSTVFTSLLCDDTQEQLARAMWRWVKPGGAILWYDFIYNNPHNSDVRGVSIKRIRKLFPAAEICVTRMTLVPPLGRVIARIHPIFYQILNLIPWLRTHVLCWIRKHETD